MQIKALNMLGLNGTECETRITKIRYNLFLDHLCVRRKSSLFHGAANNLKPRFHIVGKQHIRREMPVTAADRRHIGLPCFYQHFLSSLFVSLHGKSCRDPRLLSFAVGVRITQDHIVIVVFNLQVSCYHNLYLLCR